MHLLIGALAGWIGLVGLTLVLKRIWVAGAYAAIAWFLGITVVTLVSAKALADGVVDGEPMPYVTALALALLAVACLLSLFGAYKFVFRVVPFWIWGWVERNAARQDHRVRDDRLLTTRSKGK